MSDVVLGSVPPLAGLYRDAALGEVRRRAGLVGAARRNPGGQGPAAALPPVRHRLTAFQHLIGQAARDAVPSAHVHTLAFPVAMSLMSRPDFPLPLLGMVHLSNTVAQTRALRADERFEAAASAGNLLPHRSGTSVEIVTEVSVEGERIWTGRSVYLARGVRSGTGTDTGAGTGDGPGNGSRAPQAQEPQAQEPQAQEPQAPRAAFAAPVPTARWSLGADTGRKYAAVSGDWNPIHLSALSARALGMKRPVAHGMYLAARLVEHVEPAAPEALEWGIEFISPVLLPGTLALSVRPRTGGASRRSEVTGWAPGASRPSFTGWVARQEPPRAPGP
jgi:acyl dehydratase